MAGEKAPNPFNPSLPARPEDFVGRTEELRQYRSRLESTKEGSSMCMAVVGNRGMGKTSFLAKCGRIAEENGCVVVRFSAVEDELVSTESLCNIILAEIRGELTKRSRLGQLKEGMSGFLEKFSFALKYEGVELSVKQERGEMPPWLQRHFREILLGLWGGASGKIPAIVILIDEAEVLEKVPGAMMFLREVFSRLGEERCGYQIILSGKLSFQDKMGERFSPLTRFFHPVELKKLSEEETETLLRTEFAKAGLGMDREFGTQVFEMSEGHPYVAISAGFVVYDGLPVGTKNITAEHLSIFSGQIDNYLNAEFFGRLYRNSSPLEREVLFGIAEMGGQAAFSEIEQATKKKKGSISPALASLVEMGAVEKRERGTYVLFHHLFREYLLERKKERG